MKSDFVLKVTFLSLSLPTPTHGHLLQVTLLRQSTSLQPRISQCSQVHSTSKSWPMEHWLAQIWNNLLSCREWITQLSHQNSSQCRQQVRNCMCVVYFFMISIGYTRKTIQPNLECWLDLNFYFTKHHSMQAFFINGYISVCVCNVWTYSWLSQLRKLYCSEVMKAKTLENDGKFHC